MQSAQLNAYSCRYPDSILKRCLGPMGQNGLGLGRTNGGVRIAELNGGAGFAEIKKVLARCESAVFTGAVGRARNSIRSIKMSYQAGRVSARSDKNYYLLWRAAPEGAWRQPIVLHQSDGLRGEKSFQ